MRAAEIVGGVAIAGLAALLGLAVLDDQEPEALRTEQSLTLDPATGDGAGSTSPDSPPATTPQDSAPTSASPTATEPPTTDTEPATTPAPTTSAAPTTTSSPARTTLPPVATIPEAGRDAIAVRVINAGAEAGAAGFVTQVLRQSGFDPLGPGDSADDVDSTTILYGPGREAEAASVNTVIEVDTQNVVSAPSSDPNWQAFGDDLDVLVLLGSN